MFEKLAEPPFGKLQMIFLVAAISLLLVNPVIMRSKVPMVEATTSALKKPLSPQAFLAQHFRSKITSIFQLVVL